MKTAKTISLALIFTLIFSAAISAQTPDHKKHWTTTGTAGTVDEADVAKVRFNGATVTLKGTLSDTVLTNGLTNDGEAKQEESDAAEGEARGEETARAAAFPPFDPIRAVIRYNVTAVEGLFASEISGDREAYQMTIRYRDNAAGAQVLVRLIETDLATGVATIRMQFDSNAFPVSGNYQVRTVGVCGPNWHFDFSQKAYHVEVTLSSTLPIASPGLTMIKINKSFCFI
jgi:hypothetical protein